METKNLFASKTFWINLLGGIASVSGMASGYIPAEAAPYVMGAGAIANLLLRLVTTQPVSISGN